MSYQPDQSILYGQYYIWALEPPRDERVEQVERTTSLLHKYNELTDSEFLIIAPPDSRSLFLAIDQVVPTYFCANVVMNNYDSIPRRMGNYWLETRLGSGYSGQCLIPRWPSATHPSLQVPSSVPTMYSLVITSR